MDASTNAKQDIQLKKAESKTYFMSRESIWHIYNNR